MTYADAHGRELSPGMAVIGATPEQVYVRLGIKRGQAKLAGQRFRVRALLDSGCVVVEHDPPRVGADARKGPVLVRDPGRFVALPAGEEGYL